MSRSTSPRTLLQGHTAAITGAGRGIGAAIAQRLAADGARLWLLGRNLATLQALAATLPDGCVAGCLAVDVADAAAVQQAWAQMAQAGAAPDILVNNAGQGRVSTFADTDDEAWLEELQLKFFSILRPTRAFLGQLRGRPDAAIVCVNSLLAVQPEPHMVATSAARAGVHNLVRSLATEFAPAGIRVNGILIGLVESGQWRRRFEARPPEDRDLDWSAWSARLAQKKHIQLGRLGLPEEAARAILFLASPLSSYTTGSHIDVSGGLSRHA